MSTATAKEVATTAVAPMIKVMEKKKAPYPFWLGGASACCAATITHPLDLTKMRLQTSKVKLGMLQAMVSTAKTEGITSLWHGLTATWLRQFTYSMTRFAVYEKAKESFITADKKVPTALELAASAGLAGGLASVVGTPAEVVLVRMCGDLNKPPVERYNYSHALSGVWRIASQEGPSKLLRGMTPTVAKGVTLNVGQLAGYDFFKNVIQGLNILPEGTATQTAATLCAGVSATTLAQPVDFIKSRYQNMKEGGSLAGLVRDAIKKDGPFVLFRGFLPSLIRLQPQTTLLFLFMENFRAIVDKQRGDA